MDEIAEAFDALLVLIKVRRNELILSLAIAKKIEIYSKEKLFALTLCFSGKIEWPNVLNLYSENIKEYDLDISELENLISQLNQ